MEKQENKLLSLSGVSVDDGSDAFKEHIKSRIELSYDESRHIPWDEASKMLSERTKERIARV